MDTFEKNDSGLDYKNKIEGVLKVESRERILQEFIISPFIKSLLDNYDVVPVDTKVNGKIHNYSFYCGSFGYQGKHGQVISYETPDICIAKNWKWINEKKNKDDYIATVEVKTVFSKNQFWVSPGYNKNTGEIIFQNSVESMIKVANSFQKKVNGEYCYHEDDNYEISIQKQVAIHLRGIDKLIVTDGIRWIFFYKIDEKVYALPEIDLGRRICKKAIKYYNHVEIEWYEKDCIIKGKKQFTSLFNFELLKYVIKEFCNRKLSQMDELGCIITRGQEKISI